MTSSGAPQAEADQAARDADRPRVVIATPFPRESDSRAARLANFLQDAGFEVSVESASVPRNRTVRFRLAEALTSRLRSYMAGARIVSSARGSRAIVAVNCELTLIAAFLRLLGRNRPILVADIYDHHGFIVRGSLAKGVFDMLEAASVRAADHVIIPIRARLAQYKSPTRALLETKAIFVSNRGFSAQTRSTWQTAAEGPTEACSPAVEIAYFGTIDEGRGLAQLVRASAGLSNIARVSIHGDGTFAPHLARLAADNSKVELHGAFSHQQVGYLSRRADLLWAAYDLSVPNNRFCDPNKFREHIDLDRPLLTNPGHPLAEDLHASGSGFVVPLDAQGLHDALAGLDRAKAAASRPSGQPAARARLDAAISDNLSEAHRLVALLGGGPPR